ncbi:hypothetical protein, conserved [Plasmodium gonderi]|uniref:Tyrosine-protein kinase ephrin type A/B receptor-like domain-containing protein n=1 Tax=Plasmodium gonderi TaxID=77519 RepID=A0A1Y1JFX1_PLAGO|nr:hypothetical protein, conserved [Plasmodium gonderi]GAW80107.1 hypothetical protein, conserved [Plasmodium gonderi]
MGIKFVILMNLAFIRWDTEIYELINKLGGEKKIRQLSVKCKAGEMLTHNYKCEKCKKGFYNISRDNKICLPCPLGTFSNKLGSIVCRNCPDGSTTKSTGSKVSLDCVCNKGFKLDTIVGRCTKCNSLESCDDDDDENVWSYKNMCMKERGKEYAELCNKVRTNEVYNFQILCFKKGVCLNDKGRRSCLEGNKLIQCKICAENFRQDFITPAKSPCVFCSFATYVIVLYFVALALFINILIVNCINNEREIRIIRIFIKYMQFMSLLRYVNSNYSNFLLHVLHFFTIGIPLNEIFDCLFMKINFLLVLPLLLLVFSILGTVVLVLLRKEGENTTSSLARNNKLKAKENWKYFMEFFILYHEYLYFEIMRLCIFFYFCNYDEFRRGNFLIIDDSLECTKMKSKYFIKIWIIVIYNTFVNFFHYFLFPLKKYVKEYVPILDALWVIKLKVSTLSPSDDFFLLLFLILFYKRFFNNINISLDFYYKNGIYNNNIHTFQFVIIVLLFFLYILIMFLCVYEYNDYTVEVQPNGYTNKQHMNNGVKSLHVYEDEEEREKKENKINIMELHNNRIREVEKEELKNANLGTQNEEMSNVPPDNSHTREVMPYVSCEEEEEEKRKKEEGLNMDKCKSRNVEKNEDPKFDGKHSESKNKKYYVVQIKGTHKQIHCIPLLGTHKIVSWVYKWMRKSAPIDKFFYYFSMFIYLTILLSYYTFLSYVHTRNLLDILTIICVTCNGLIYATISMLFIIFGRESYMKKENKKWFTGSFIKKRIEKMKGVNIFRRRMGRGTKIEERNGRNVKIFNVRNNKIEEQYVSKNEKRSIKLINNILKNSTSFKIHFEEIDLKLEVGSYDKVEEKKKFIKRYKLLKISKKWILFLQNILDLSDEPEKCICMLINLTLDKEFPSLDMDTCLKILKKNHFAGMKNVETILKNFLKYTNQFLSILERKQKRKKKHATTNGSLGRSGKNHDEMSIIFAWGLGILSFGNLQDINYNISTILFHVSNVLSKCRYMKYLIDYYYFRNIRYFGSLPFYNVGNYCLTNETIAWGTDPICTSFINSMYEYEYEEQENNINVIDTGVGNHSMKLEVIRKDYHSGRCINGRSTHISVDASKQQTHLKEKFEKMDQNDDCNNYDKCDMSDKIRKMENLQEELPVSLINRSQNNIPQTWFTNGGRGRRYRETKGGFPFEYDLTRVYARELCRIYIHCLLADVSEMYLNIYYTQECEKYLQNGILNLWGCHKSVNLYMKRYYKHLENCAVFEGNMNVNCLEGKIKYEDGNNMTGITFNIEDYLSKRVIEIDFYGQFEYLSCDMKKYLINLTQEGDYLNINELTKFSEAHGNKLEEKEKRKKKEREEEKKKRKKKSEEFFKIFTNALPVSIEKCCLKFLDENEFKVIEEEKRKKRNFIISCENMGDEYFNIHVLKNYEEKITYFQIDSYGGVISVKGEFVSKGQTFSSVCNNEKEKRKTNSEVERGYNTNLRKNEDDYLLTEDGLEILNKNMHSFMNYDRVRGSQLEIFTHNCYENYVGITGDLKGMNFRDKNSLVIVNPPIIIPKECTIELWLFVNSRNGKTNGNEKNFLFCDIKGNSLFVIVRKGGNIEDVEIHISDKRKLSSYFKKMNTNTDEKNGNVKGEKVPAKNDSCSVYIKCKKSRKWNKIHTIVKQDQWNLLHLTKCTNGLIYYINGKYINSISNEILNLDNQFEMSIFGNSCFGNNNIGLCSSFKIFEFLNKEEIKRRYRIIKNLKGREIVGDNLCMEIKDDIIEGIDIRDKCMQNWVFFMYFSQSQKENTRVLPVINDSNYKVSVYQLRFVVSKFADNNLHKRQNVPWVDKGGIRGWPYRNKELQEEMKKLEGRNEENKEDNKELYKRHEKIIRIDNREEYGYNVYFKKVKRKKDVPKIYGIDIFSDLLTYACDLSKFYNLILNPSLSIYNELAKPFGYTLCLWIFLPIEKNISFSALVSGEKDAHICIFSNHMVIGCIENYKGEKKNGITFYHSSGCSIKSMKRGWYYLTVVGTLRGQFYFINGFFKGYHKFCSFDNIKYIGNSSLFINPFPYISFFKMVTKPLSVNEIMYEYSCPTHSNLNSFYSSSYLYFLFANLFTGVSENNNSIVTLSDKSSPSTDLEKEQYVHFEITECCNVHIYPYRERENYDFTLSVTSMENRKLYFFNKRNYQINNLNIHLNVIIVLPQYWTIFAFVNLSYVNKYSYHCLVGGENGSSHIAIKGSDLSLGVLTNSSENFLQKEVLDEVSNEEKASYLRMYYFGNDQNKSTTNRNIDSDNIILCPTNQRMYYQKFNTSGYTFQGEQNKEILLTTRCRINEQTFFINSHKVGVCKSCLSPISCIGNCLSVNNEYLSPFGLYKFVRIVFEDVTDENIGAYYHSLHLLEEQR